MRLTISDLLKPGMEHSPVYVINKTRGDYRGPVIFTAPRLNGRGVDTVRVPDTYLPTNLLDYVPRGQLMESTDFRGALNQQLLWLIDEAEALEIMSKPGAKEEVERLNKLNSKLASGVSSVIGATHAEALQESDSEEGLNKRMKSLLQRIGEEGVVNVINSLRAIEDDLSKEDLSYLITFAEERGFQKLKKYAQNRQSEA